MPTTDPMTPQSEFHKRLERAAQEATAMLATGGKQGMTKIERFTVQAKIKKCLESITKLGDDPDNGDYADCIGDIRYNLSFLADWINCIIDAEERA